MTQHWYCLSCKRAFLPINGNLNFEAMVAKGRKEGYLVGIPQRHICNPSSRVELRKGPIHGQRPITLDP